MRSNHVKITISKKLDIFLISLSVAFAVLPVLTYDAPKIIWVIIIFTWYLNIFISGNRKIYFTKESSPYIILLIWIFWTLLLKSVGYSSASIGNYLLMIAALDMMVKSFYVLRKYSLNEKRILFVIILLIIVVTIIQNLVVYILNPGAFVSFYYFPSTYRGTNLVRDALFYHMVAFFSGNLFYLIFQSSKARMKFLYIGLIFLSAIFLFTINPRMNSVIILFFLLSLELFIQGQKIRNNMIIFLSLIIFVIFFVVLFGRDIYQLLPERLSARVDSLTYFLSQGYTTSDSSSLTARIRLQLNSLNTFISSVKNFLFGTGLHLGSEYYDLIGQHGYFTTNLAAYGILGGALSLYIFFPFRKLFISNITNISLRRQAKVIWLAFFILLIISDGFRAGTIASSFLLLACIDTKKNFQQKVVTNG